MGVVAVGLEARAGSGDDADRVPGSPPRLSLVESGEPRGGGARPTRVLLVEDDPSMRLLCMFNLEAAGFEVVTAENGADALERAGEGRFDLVLLDVMLPDLGGIEVAGRLLGKERDPVPPIVFVSARGSEADVERGRLAGAIDYVVKPFDPVALPERLRDDLAELERSGVAGVWRLRSRREHP